MDKIITINPDKINMSEKIIIPGRKYLDLTFDELFIKYSITIDGHTKVILFENSTPTEIVSQQQRAEFYHETLKEIKNTFQTTYNAAAATTATTTTMTPSQKQQTPQSPIECYVSVLFKRIGISVINNHSMTARPTELMYIYMQNTEFILLQKKESMLMQFKMRFLNIDNNSQPLVNFPVVLTPSKYQSHFADDTSKAFLNILVEKNSNASNMNLFNSVVLDIEVIKEKYTFQ